MYSIEPKIFPQITPQNPPVLPKLHSLNNFRFSLLHGLSTISESPSWTKEATKQFECSALETSNEWETAKIGFGRQMKKKTEQNTPYLTWSQQKENHNFEGEVTTW